MIKKLHFLCASLIFSSQLVAQVGINTSAPNATLEVFADSENITVTDGIIAPKLTGEQLKSKDALYDALQTSALVYITSGLSSGDTTAKTINVTEKGYFFFDGSVWQKMKGGNETFSIDATNGLTKDGSRINLGGNLNKVTTIGTDIDNTLRVTGLQDAQTDDEIMVVDSDGTLRKSQISLNFITTLNSIAKRTTRSAANIAANRNTTVVYDNVEKNNSAFITYDTSTGRFMVMKAGYYQITVFNVIDTSSNANGQTAGTARTTLLKNSDSIAGSSTNHGERTEIIQHSISSSEYFNIGDFISVIQTHTRPNRIGAGGNISIINLGE